jgi:hypothetical protein
VVGVARLRAGGRSPVSAVTIRPQVPACRLERLSGPRRGPVGRSRWSPTTATGSSSGRCLLDLAARAVPAQRGSSRADTARNCAPRSSVRPRRSNPPSSPLMGGTWAKRCCRPAEMASDIRGCYRSPTRTNACSAWARLSVHPSMRSCPGPHRPGGTGWLWRRRPHELLAVPGASSRTSPSMTPHPRTETHHLNADGFRGCRT